MIARTPSSPVQPSSSSGEHADTPRELIPGHPMLGLGYAKPLTDRDFIRVGANTDDVSSSVAVAEEVPVALQFNGRPYVVMMATPADLEDFAAGFALSEQVIHSPAELRAIHVIKHARGIELQIEIAEAAAQRIELRSRNLVGRTGCGLCGVEMIEDVLRAVAPVQRTAPFSVNALAQAESGLSEAQPWNGETAAMHAAAFATRDGALAIVREDVGRHNALDKVLGAMLRESRNASDGFIVVTSRASYEMVQKAAVAGITLVAAVSRPTGLAIRLAESSGITLVGLLRNGTANVYANVDGLEGHSKVSAAE